MPFTWPSMWPCASACGHAIVRQATTRRMSRVETEARCRVVHSCCCGGHAGRWIDRVHEASDPSGSRLDVGTTGSPNYGEQDPLPERPFSAVAATMSCLALNHSGY